ncbi:MAG: flagellar biosynthesis protein FlhB [Pseudomonadota bacterium]
MAEQQDNAQRTEEPTPKRLADARKKGDAPKSQEAVAAVMLAAGALALWLGAGPAARAIGEIGAVFLAHPHSFLTDASAFQQLWAAVAWRLALAVGLIALMLFAAAILANAGQARPVFNPGRLKPSLERVSMIASAKRIFGPSGLFNFAKGVGKIAIIGALLVFALWPDRDILTESLTADARSLLEMTRMLALKLIGLTVASMLLVAGLDYAFQRHSWKKRLRMTKDEVRREQKETDGDPQIKARVRQLREQRMRQRMTAAVKDATVVIMNPTHFAVALDYEMGAEAAPVCVAKGVDDLALRMRSIAQEHGVPVIENPPLARALHASVEVDEEIPLEHYEAVARVIGFIMKKSKPRK